MGSGEIPIELGDSWFSEIALGLASSDDYWSRALFGRGPLRVTEFRQTPNAN